MEKFKGFSAKMRFTPVPNVFLSSLLPQINDIDELKTTLHIFRVIYAKRGYPRFVTYRELLGSSSLMVNLREKGSSMDDRLRNALDQAVTRGTILHLALVREEKPEDVYFLNTESDKRAVARIKAGELSLSGLKSTAISDDDLDTEPVPDVFTLYEENIGMLTPMIAEELSEAEKLYPEGWIKDAIREAVSLNKRSWRYISRILESWSAEGKSDGTHRRDTKKTDPGKYGKQGYGHMVRR